MNAGPNLRILKRNGPPVMLVDLPSGCRGDLVQGCDLIRRSCGAEPARGR